MVGKGPELGHYTITGIIDGEDDGFYSADDESIATTQDSSPVHEDSWYLYLAKCISP